MAGFPIHFLLERGHTPPCLAGRQTEREEFLRLVDQSPVLENMILTGLHGVGKTVLRDSLKPVETSRGWVWGGADLSESASLSEFNLATRLFADLSRVTSNVVVSTEEVRAAGFIAETRDQAHTRVP